MLWFVCSKKCVDDALISWYISWWYLVFVWFVVSILKHVLLIWFWEMTWPHYTTITFIIPSLALVSLVKFIPTNCFEYFQIPRIDWTRLKPIWSSAWPSLRQKDMASAARDPSFQHPAHLHLQSITVQWFQLWWLMTCKLSEAAQAALREVHDKIQKLESEPCKWAENKLRSIDYSKAFQNSST